MLPTWPDGAGSTTRAYTSYFSPYVHLLLIPWFYLFLAAVCEVGWPVGMKLAALHPSARILWIIFAIVTMALSGIFLFIAQKHIPIGTAYAIWTGIGAAATFLIGIAFFHAPASLLRFLGVALILSGVILLKLAN
ncbi:MAG: multidrug efflux SMR transporter, partial [Akkermansia sp.]|nr:multidrug efflux SMR transporter [Akkermansia sp.]